MNLKQLKETWPDNGTDVVLPILPELLQQIQEGTKIAEYRSYRMDNVQRIWFCANHNQQQITVMAEVTPAEIHDDRRPDGTFKRPYKYRFRRVFNLKTPFTCNHPRLKEEKPSGPVTLNNKPKSSLTLIQDYTQEYEIQCIDDISHPLLQQDYGSSDQEHRSKQEYSYLQDTDSSPPTEELLSSNQCSLPTTQQKHPSPPSNSWPTERNSPLVHWTKPASKYPGGRKQGTSYDVVSPSAPFGTTGPTSPTNWARGRNKSGRKELTGGRLTKDGFFTEEGASKRGDWIGLDKAEKSLEYSSKGFKSGDKAQRLKKAKSQQRETKGNETYQPIGQGTVFLRQSQKPSFQLADASLCLHKTSIEGRQAPLSGKGGSSARRIALGRHDDGERTSKTHSLLYQKHIKHSPGKDQEETPLGTMGKHSPEKDAATLWSGIEQNRTE
jgi:hypothetical protein